MTKTEPLNPTERMTVPDDLDGARLDRALEALLPGSGLRLRRRAIESGRVLVEGRPAQPGLKLRAGQDLSLLPEAEPQLPDVPLPRIVARTRDFAAVDKPAGLNSASLAGGGGASLEAMLPALFPDAQARLLNRLDRATSGLVLVALTPGGERRFADIAPGRVVKEYLAVVLGELDEPLTLKRRLDTDDRKRTRVLGKLEPEPAAWTQVWPEGALEGGRTLVRVRIASGARHQIRAHLAAAALPIVGDALYGEGEDAGGLRLHHRLLEFQGFRAECPPPWQAELEGAQERMPGGEGAAQEEQREE